MQTEKHTPGPWLYLEGRSAVSDINDKGIACAYMKDVGYAQAEANARLIASAPELLEVLALLCELGERIKEPAYATQITCLLARGSAAIAKAEDRS